MDAVLLIVVAHKDQEYYSEGDCINEKRRDCNIPKKYIVDYINCLITKLMSRHPLILSDYRTTRTFIAIMWRKLWLLTVRSNENW